MIFLPLSNPLRSTIDLVNILKEKYKLSRNQLYFMVCWYLSCEHKGFGFIYTPDFEDKVHEATRFMVDTEKKWQNDLINNRTENNFYDFFIEKLNLQAEVELPDNFRKEFIKLLNNNNVVFPENKGVD